MWASVIWQQTQTQTKLRKFNKNKSDNSARVLDRFPKNLSEVKMLHCKAQIERECTLLFAGGGDVTRAMMTSKHR